MKLPVLAVTLLTAACLTTGATLPARAQTVGTLLKSADDAYEEKSYARALELYRRYMSTGAEPRVEDLRYRILVCLFKTQKWDEAIADGESLAKTANWKARVHYVLGQIYFRVPHQGYKIKDKIYRGEDYPKTEGAERPQQVWLLTEDLETCAELLHTAKIEAQRERDIAMRSRFATPIYPMPSDQEIDLNFDLTGLIQQQEMDEFIQAMDAGKGGDENIDPTQPFDPKWSLPKKVIYLYNDIPRLDQSETKHDSALATLTKGLFLQSYLERMRGWAPKQDPKTGKTTIRPFPFQSLSELTVFKQVVEQYPRDYCAERAQLLIGDYYRQRGTNFVKAVAAYRELIQNYPKSRLVPDARANIEDLTRREVDFYFTESGRPRPGKRPQIRASAHNVAKVDFAVYRIKLEQWLTKPSKVNEPETQFTSFKSNFGPINTAVKYFGKPIASWSWITGDKKDYASRFKDQEIPVTAAGAYVVTARSGGVWYAGVIVISDLTILKKSDRKGTMFFLANARGGAPVRGANILVKEVYYQEEQKVSSVQGKTDASGLFDKKRFRGPDTFTNNISAFAWLGDRYALTDQEYYNYWSDEDERRGRLKLLSYTDRPVYRPGQKVYFRQVFTSRKGNADWKPAAGLKVNLTANNPKGESAFSKQLTTNEFGSVSGEFILPAGAPLGEWSVNSYVDETNRNLSASGGNRFRVEEYKRPEFQVTVTAPTDVKRPGETVAASINAKYYFGSPVPNATVKYTVRRSVWWSSFNFPSPYDWLFQYWGAGDYATGRRNIGGEGSGQIVKEGTAKTDASGNAEVSFKTAAPDGRADGGEDWSNYFANPLYTVEAEVTDASRRTIEGQGQVKVANQQYFAFTQVKRGFFKQGDRIQVEVHTQDANENPVSAAGKMVYYRLLPNDEKLKVFEEPVRTDAQGRLFWSRPLTQAGEFSIAWESTDAWGKTVRSSSPVWVDGVGLDKTTIRLSGMTILLDKRYYTEGETLRALVVADRPGSTILLTQENGEEIMRRDVFTLKGRSRVITIPINRSHVPNFFLSAATVRDYEVHQEEQEVFVPPAKEMLNVSVSGDKSEYKPGDKGTFTIKATDWKGQPVRGEFSLALIDASLFYIQKDYTPDVRSFYYADRRGSSLQLGSNQPSFDPDSQSDQPRGNYQRHYNDQLDGLGQLNLMPSLYGANEDRFAYCTTDGANAPMPAASIASRGPARGGEALQRSSKSHALGIVANGAAAMDEGAPPAVQVRSNFAETAYWSPAVITEGGQAKVQVTFPDSITQWHATARGLTNQVAVGSAETDTVTRKDLMVRLQAPRFFVERDEVTISANVHNYSKQTQKIRVNLSGLDSQTGALAPESTSEQIVEVKAGDEQRVDWRVNVVRDGKVDLQVVARGVTESDAMKLSFPVLVHGIQRFAGQSGVMKQDGTATATINFPKERRFGASQLNVQLNPSMAAQMLDALPYLAGYPYGCVEQTMSRFLPSALAAKTLTDSGVNLSTLQRRAKAYAAEAKAKPLGERIANSGYSYPRGMPNSRDLDPMADRYWNWYGSSNPVYDPAELNHMVNEGLNRLYGMQREDGGWGWWSGSGRSDTYMTAYVVYGLAQARTADLPVRDEVLSNGFDFLEKQLKDEDDLHLLTYMLYSLSFRGKLSTAGGKLAAGRLFTERERLTPYSQSLLAMALWNNGDKEKAALLVRNLENTCKVDDANGTAHWQMARYWWYWYNNDEETNAVALRAFLLIDGNNRLVPMLMKWLTTNARAGHWSSTKATAETVYSLADYVRRNKELDVDYTLKVNLNGKLARTYRVTPDNVLFFDNRFVTGDLFLQDGANTLTIEKSGKGNLYWNAYSEYFSLEEPIKASGNEIAITRRYFKLTRKPISVEKTSQTAPKTPETDLPMSKIVLPPPVQESKFEYDRQEIKDGDTLQSGDLVEIELILDAKNDYSYLVFEDMKPAGLEPVDLRSGYAYGDGLCSNTELRDEKVAFFVDFLPQGTRPLRYRMRAEIPGKFHALPTNGYAMYAPEVRAISDEIRVNVKD